MKKVILITLIVLSITIVSVVSLFFITQENPPTANDFDPASNNFEKITQYTGLSTSDLDDILKTGTLRVLVPFNRTDFYLVNGQPTGFQVDLIEQYLMYLLESDDYFDDNTTPKLPLNVVYLPTTYDQLIEDLVLGRGDIVASNISATPDRLNTINIASNLELSGSEIIITHKHNKTINTIDDLSGQKITVMAGSSYIENLERINTTLIEENKAPIVIEIADRLFTEIDILELVNAGIVDITVVDDYKARLWAKLLPHIKTKPRITIKDANNIGWAIRKNNPQLLASIESFQSTIKKGTFLGNYLFNKYYQDSKRVLNPLIHNLSDEKKVAIQMINKYAKLYQFNSTAVIAQAFQESNLDHSMVSDKGALGVMQILPETASYVGFDDVSALEDNVHAGVKYLDYLRKNYIKPLKLDKSNEYPFLWAAYNAGPGRIEKIQQKTTEMGLDKNIWFANAEYAALDIVGKETQNYVSNIYKYFLIYQNNKDLMAALVDKKSTQKPISVTRQ